MNSRDVKRLLFVIAAVAISAYVLTRHEPAPVNAAMSGHAPGERIGARNHSGSSSTTCSAAVA
jgi:hypothetical protein